MTAHCDPMCPFLGCASCAYSGGETPAAATESAPVSGVASGILMGPHKEAAATPSQPSARPATSWACSSSTGRAHEWRNPRCRNGIRPCFGGRVG